MQINELFDKPYSYHWTERSEDRWQAEFASDSGNNVVINFDPTDMDGREWEVNFYIKGTESFHATGTGDEFRVFGTVVSVIKDWWNAQRVKPQVLEFSAEKSTGSRSLSRVKLYDRFARQFVSRLGPNYVALRNETNGAVYYQFKLRKKKNRNS